MRGFLILLVAVLMAFSIAGQGDALNVFTADGTIYDTQGLTDFQTSGDDMVGMTVTATFSDESVESILWAAGDTGSGGVEGENDIWSLMVTGDTFDEDNNRNWTLSVSDSFSLTNLFIDAGTGDTVFDIIPDTTSSPESFLGKPIATGYSGDLTATYSDLVGVNGTVYDDLYRTLNLYFGSGGFSNDTIFFSADTDNLALSGDIHPVDPANPVPEPATMLLLGTGLMGLAGFGREKFFKKS